MFEQYTDREERGQVGIGTLIVFIALVLVAAIAAGVLINTAGFLQTQAQSTGEESTEQVSTNIIFLSTTGTTEDVDPPEAIQSFETTVQLGPGSSAVDLSQTTISVFTDDGEAAEYDGVNDDNDEIALIEGEEVLSTDSGSDAATATIEIDPDPSATDPEGQFEEETIDTGTTVEIVLTTPEGTQAENSFIIEDPLDPQLEGDEDIRLD